VVHVEGWASAVGELRAADGHTVASRFNIHAPPAGSPFLSHPPLTEGRWLREGDQNALAISTQITLDHPELEIGDTIRLRINGRDAPFVIVGKYTWTRGDEAAALAHASYAYVSRLLGEANRARTYRVMLESSDPAFQERTGALLSEALKRRGYTPVIMTLASAEGTVTAGADALAASLMIVALLIVGVGGISLASTMSMNVLERTREIGVMRAIGASSGDVRRLVVVEGVLVGLLSWAIAFGASFPLSRLLCQGMGLVLLQRPLDYVFDWTGVVIWVGLIVVISALASLWPAVNAAQLTVRDALAYE
jgi:putative ABC transport system permease protein